MPNHTGENRKLRSEDALSEDALSEDAPNAMEPTRRPLLIQKV